MTAPCEQKDSITSIVKTLDRMEKGQERLVELLERQANQDAKISHLEEHAENAYRDMNTLFERVRDVELNQATYGPEARLRFQEIMEEVTKKMDDINGRIERLLRFYRLMTGKVACYVYGLILAMIVVSFAGVFVNHSDWLKAIIKFFL